MGRRTPGENFFVEVQPKQQSPLSELYSISIVLGDLPFLFFDNNRCNTCEKNVYSLWTLQTMMTKCPMLKHMNRDHHITWILQTTNVTPLFPTNAVLTTTTLTCQTYWFSLCQSRMHMLSCWHHSTTSWGQHIWLCPTDCDACYTPSLQLTMHHWPVTTKLPLAMTTFPGVVTPLQPQPILP